MAWANWWWNRLSKAWNASLNFAKNFFYKSPLRLAWNLFNTLVNAGSGLLQNTRRISSDIAWAFLDTAWHLVDPITPEFVAEPIKKGYGKTPWWARPK